MTGRGQGDADYVLGASKEEQERLRAQADAVGPMTERFLVQAGIAPGMKLLDMGCGSGDVERSGADVHMGLKLYSVLVDAGLSVPELRAEAIVQTPSTHYPTVPLIRVLLPGIVECGIATEREVEVETLEERLLEERQSTGASYIGQVVFGAWARRPS